MALTLVEAAKLYRNDPIRQSFIEIYGTSTNLLRVLPFDTITGPADMVIVEDEPGRADFRLVNASYTAGSGTVSRVAEPLVICGGELDIDNFIMATGSPDTRATQEMMKAKRMGHLFTQKVFKGDQSSSVAEFNGLQVRLDGTDQEVINDASGAGLSLLKLDEGIDKCKPRGGMKVLAMNQSMVRRFKQGARATTTSSSTTNDRSPAILGDLFRVTERGPEYDGIPILTIDDTDDIYTSLPFTETEGGSSVCTSIYVLALGPADLCGIQHSDLAVKDLGEQQASPSVRTRLEWFAGISLRNPRGAVRIAGVTNAAITE